MAGKDYTGLEAELYDLFRGGDELDEVGLYTDVAAEQGGSCLDVGCGTGRVLIPLVQEGVEVVGVDSSPAMVTACKDRLVAEGLEAEVHVGDMVDFDLGRKFDLVIVPGASFQLLDERDTALAALARLKAHVAPGGLLAMSLFTPWYEITHESLDGVWRLEKDETTDGGRRALCHASNELDRCEQLMEVQHRLELLDGDGKIVDSEYKTSRLRWYAKYEIELLLKAAGFGTVDTLGDFGDEEAGDGHVAMAVIAKVKTD